MPSGIYNVADDEPLTKREYVDAFGAAFGLKKLRIPPAWMARLVTGVNAPADIGYDSKRNVLAIPRFNDNKVEYFRIQ